VESQRRCATKPAGGAGQGRRLPAADLAGVCHRGTAFDTGHYSGTGDNNNFCDDNFSGPGKPPMNLGTAGDITFPAGNGLRAMIVMTGDTSRSWGWYVYQRDGFEKPDQFGYAPDGYHLQIVAAFPLDYPQTVSATSPCFGGEFARDDISSPAVLKDD
jgi:hypothetical protein